MEAGECNEESENADGKGSREEEELAKEEIVIFITSSLSLMAYAELYPKTTRVDH